RRHRLLSISRKSGSASKQSNKGRRRQSSRGAPVAARGGTGGQAQPAPRSDAARRSKWADSAALSLTASRAPSVRIGPAPPGAAIASLLHQGRQAELPVGSTEWLLAVVRAVPARPQAAPARTLARSARRERLDALLRAPGLSYGTGALA